MKDVESPQANIPVVGGDGTLTTHGLIVLEKMADAVKELQAENTALTARVAALEALHP